MNVEAFTELSYAKSWRIIRDTGIEAARHDLAQLEAIRERRRFQVTSEGNLLRLNSDIAALTDVIERYMAGVDDTAVTAGCLSEERWDDLIRIAAIDALSDREARISHMYIESILIEIVTRHDPICLIDALGGILLAMAGECADLRSSASFAMLGRSLHSLVNLA